MGQNDWPTSTKPRASNGLGSEGGVSRDVRYGPRADFFTVPFYVGFAPESGHLSAWAGEGVECRDHSEV